MINISTFTLKVVREKTARYELERTIRNPMDCYNVATEVIKLHEQTEETMQMITLDVKCNMTGIFEVSRGALNSSIVHPREIYKRALLQNANSIVLMHNHPSGDVTPSHEDISITTRIAEAGKLMGVELLDHIIVGYRNYCSMKEKGII